MENLKTIENIARICVISQSHDYIQGNLFIRENSKKYYKIKMSKNIYFKVLEEIEEKRVVILERKGFKYADEKIDKKAYTPEEVEIIKSNLHLTCVQLAKRLNRTVGSVNGKLSKLRKENNYLLEMKNYL